MKLLKPLLFLYFFFVTEAEPQNGTNATLVWWPPDSSSLVLGVHFGAPGGGGGPGAASADVFISLRLDVPDNWGGAASLDALTTLVSQEVEVATRHQVIDVLSELKPQAPYTITMAGSLFGGAPDCPFYHETQVPCKALVPWSINSMLQDLLLLCGTANPHRSPGGALGNSCACKGLSCSFSRVVQRDMGLWGFRAPKRAAKWATKNSPFRSLPASPPASCPRVPPASQAPSRHPFVSFSRPPLCS